MKQVESTKKLAHRRVMAPLPHRFVPAPPNDGALLEEEFPDPLHPIPGRIVNHIARGLKLKTSHFN